MRACEKTYEEEELTSQGIDVQELQFPDGQIPDKQVIEKWLKIVDAFFDGPESDRSIM